MNVWITKRTSSNVRVCSRQRGNPQIQHFYGCVQQALGTRIANPTLCKDPALIGIVLEIWSLEVISKHKVETYLKQTYPASGHRQVQDRKYSNRNVQCDAQMFT